MPQDLSYTEPKALPTTIPDTDVNQRLVDLLSETARLTLGDVGVPVDHPIMNLLLACEDHEILDALANVHPPRNQDLLLSVLISLRAGKPSDAEALLNRSKGMARDLAATPSPAKELLEPINSEDVIALDELGEEQLLHHMKSGNFADWMLYLHPDQASLATEKFSGTTRLHGVSGSGKTCVLVHRAVQLAKRYQGQSIAIVTLNRALAKLLSELLEAACPPTRRSHIHVFAMYDLCHKITTHFGPNEVLRDLDPDSGETPDHTWDDYWDKHHVRVALTPIVDSLERNNQVDAKRYIHEEFVWIRSGFSRNLGNGSSLPPRSAYLDAAQSPRTGRSITFRAEWRKLVLEALEEYERYLRFGNLADADELALEAHRFVSRLRSKSEHPFRFRCLLVDECQDLGSVDLEILGSLVRDDQDGLFLVGDPEQRVSTRLQDLGAARMILAHRRYIRKNYRNPRRILEAGLRLLSASPSTTPNEHDSAPLPPELSARDTARPAAFLCKSRKEAFQLLSTHIRAGQGESPGCIVGCRLQLDDDRALMRLAESLRRQGIEATPITHAMRHQPSLLKGGLFVASLGSVKGFEFGHVYVLDADFDSIPFPGLPSAESWRSARRLYVAMTRARDSLTFYSCGIPSRFLSFMGETIAWRAGSSELDYDAARDEARRSSWTRVPAPSIPTLEDTTVNLGLLGMNAVSCAVTFLKEGELLTALKYGLTGTIHADLPFRSTEGTVTAKAGIGWCVVKLLSSLAAVEKSAPSSSIPTGLVAAVLDLESIAGAPAWYVAPHDKTPIHELWRRGRTASGPVGIRAALQTGTSSAVLGMAYVPGPIPSRAILRFGFPTIQAYNGFLLRNRTQISNSDRRRFFPFPEGFQGFDASDLSIASSSSVVRAWELTPSLPPKGNDHWWSGKGAPPTG